MPEMKVAAPETVTDDQPVAVPESAFENSEVQAQARDPHTGRYVSVTLGADAHPEDNEPIAGDRGDDPSAVPSTQVSESPDDKAPEDKAPEETKDDAAKPEGTKDEGTKDQGTQEDEGLEEAEEQRIPKKRFNEVNERRKAAERRVQELEKRLESLSKAEEGGFDFKAAEREYMELVLDGKFDEAVEKREEIDTAKEAKYRKTASVESLEADRVTTIKETIDAMSEDAAVRYAEFDPESDVFSDEMVDEIEALYVGFQQSRGDKPGFGPIKALEKAIESVAKMHGLKDRSAEPPAPKKGPRNTTAEKVAKARQQPPVPTTDAGRPADDGGDLAVEQMSDRELDKLEKENPGAYARLRGDIAA